MPCWKNQEDGIGWGGGKINQTHPGQVVDRNRDGREHGNMQESPSSNTHRPGGEGEGNKQRRGVGRGRGKQEGTGIMMLGIEYSP